MWKPVRLQGYGAGTTTINAMKAPAEKLLLWRQKVESLVTGGFVDLLPGQGQGFGGIEPATLFNEEGCGILVLAKDLPAGSGGFGLDSKMRPNARIDGFTITGADHAGGIMVNAFAHFLGISNNVIRNNNGVFAGGIRIGHPQLTADTPGGLDYPDAQNDHIDIHHNHITQNSGLDGAGGGISLCTGSDYYEVYDNFICGNLTLGEGGGIGHLGLSESPGGYNMITRNTIAFNESFNQGLTVGGGGIFIGGGLPLGGPGSLSNGSGPVKVVSNLIIGNASGEGDGGGIRVARSNGQDVSTNPTDRDAWYQLDIFNNFIVNNIAGMAGGGISLLDTARLNIVNNTIANNDSTATAGSAFDPDKPNQSNPQCAGVVSHAHTTEFAAAFGPGTAIDPYRDYSNPRLTNNVIWHNRSFYFFGDATANPPVYGLLPAPTSPVYDDLAVVGTQTTQRLNPTFCLLTDRTGYATNNRVGNPAFVASYNNGDRGLAVIQPEITTAIQAPPAFDEGGNFIRLRFGPLTLTNPATGLLFGDYHLTLDSAAARDRGTNNMVTMFQSLLGHDVDGDIRPNPDTNRADIGADEFYSTPGAVGERR